MKIIFISILIGLLTIPAAFARDVTVPITVTGTTYTVPSGTTVPNDVDYYTYSGHRCYTSEQKQYSNGVTVTTESGPSLYCYSNP